MADPDLNPAAGASDAVGAVTPEVVDALQTPSPGNEGSADGEQVSRPTKLIRIASMVRALLDEARLAPLDDAGRRSLKEIHERSVHELEGILSDRLGVEWGPDRNGSRELVGFSREQLRAFSKRTTARRGLSRA